MPSRSDSLHLVATGLRLVYAGLLLVILGAFTPLLTIPLSLGLKTTLMLSLGVMILGFALDIAGRLCCLAMPADASTARPMIYLSVLFTLIALGISAAQLLSLFMPELELPLSDRLGTFGTPISIIGSLLFLLFLRQVALYVGNQKLADRVWIILILGVVLVIGAAGIVLQAFNAQGAGDVGMMGLIAIVVLVLALVELILYGNLLTYLSADVRKAADRDSERLEDEEEM